MARRSRMFRDRTSCTNMSAVSMPTPITRASRRTIACGPSSGACLRRSRRASFDLADQITDQPPPIHVATQLSHRIGRYWLVLGRAQIFKSPGGLLQLGIEAADAEPDQGCFHSVDNPSLLSDEALALAVGPLGIFVLARRD